MKFDTYRGYSRHLPTSGGKAGKGRNKTSTVQIRTLDGSQIVKSIRYSVNEDRQSHVRQSDPLEIALLKAKAWIRANPKA